MHGANGEPGAIVFEGHSVWSFWARGTYRRSSLSARTAYIKNSLATVDVTVTKVWADEGDKDGIRPQAVTVHVCAGDEDTGVVLELSEDNGWTAVARDLDEYADGETISYRVVEDVPEGYEASVTQEGNTFTVVNTHVPEEPADPVKPDDPVDPVKPDDPTDPVKPDDPTKPEDPVKPSDPAKPIDPAKPTDSVKAPTQQPTRPPAVPSTGDSTMQAAAEALVLAIPAVLAAASALRRAWAGKTHER